MNQIGFGYVRDGNEFAHGSGIFVITPTGEISQYFTGIEFPASDVRLGLVEASKGRIGTPIDHVLLFCFRFDPTKGRYTLMAGNIMRAGGAITLLALIFIFVLTFRRREANR
jgi:protein SCO1/2